MIKMNTLMKEFIKGEEDEKVLILRLPKIKKI